MNRTIIIALILLVAPGCDSTPAEQEQFRDEVVPLLESRCAGAACHGITPDAPQAGERPGDEGYLFDTDDDGQIADWQQARRETLRFVNAVEDPFFSSLLRKPLPADSGGQPHDGGANFTSLDDPALHPLRRWIELEPEGGEDPSPPELNDREQFFADQVQPQLIGRNCASSRCHGETSSNGLQLDPGIPGEDPGPRFGVQISRDNYEQTRPFLALDGDPSESRLHKKALPLEQGGITHRGGNRTFFTDADDPAVEAIEQWAEKERTHQRDDADSDPLHGVVYIRSSTDPSPPFEVTDHAPGSDLYLRRPAAPDGQDHNLTAHLHDGDADIRDPAVCHDGRRVAFAMRTGSDDAHALYELDLNTDEVHRLTDHEHTDVMPTWGPDDTLYFVSDRHHPDAEQSNLALYSLQDDQSPRRITFGVGPHINPRYFDVGAFQGHLTVAHRRTLGDEDETVGFEFPVDFGADFHIFFGTTAPYDHFLVFDEMPDGRALTILSDPDNRWPAGKLAVVDRNLGPELGPDDSIEDAAVDAYTDSLRVLDSSVRPTGLSWGGAYRDPVALPDGSVLVAHAPGPADLTDPDADMQFRLRRLTIREAADGCTTLECTPRIDSIETWLDPPDGESVHSPRPVVDRVTTGPDNTAPDPEEPTTFELADAAVHQMLLDHPFAAGPKPLRNDIHYLRLIEAADFPSDAPMPDGHPPARILAEVELKADDSAFADIPAETPFRTQLLDEHRMAVGEQHNRWIFAWPGQRFPSSIGRDGYNLACAGCHGTRSGDRDDLVVDLDVSSAASATLASFEDRNPRRPRTPTAVDESTRPVTYVDDVEPIVQRRCATAGCHGEQPGPDDDFGIDYPSLIAGQPDSEGARRWVDTLNTSARTSLLVEVAADRQFDGPGPPMDHPDPEVTDDELLTLIRWIETGAAYRSPTRWNSPEDR